jgi:hypothetical protein
MRARSSRKDQALKKNAREQLVTESYRHPPWEARRGSESEGLGPRPYSVATASK